MTTEMAPSEVSPDVNERFEAWLKDEPAEPEETADEEDGQVDELSAESNEEPDEGESEEDEADESEPVEKLVIDGEEFEYPKELAPLAEKLKGLEASLRSDHTRKTQEAAEMRKSVEAEQQHLHQEAAFIQQNTDLMVEWQTAAKQLKEYEGVDWGALAEQDIGAYTRHKEIRDSLRQRQQEIGNEFNNRKTYALNQNAQIMHQKRAETVNAVKRAIPNYDAETDKKAVQAAVKLGEKYGFKVDPQVLSQNLDPLIWVGLVELSKHFELVGKRPETKKQVAEAKHAKPSKPQKQVTQNRGDKIRKLLAQGRLREAAQI